MTTVQSTRLQRRRPPGATFAPAVFALGLAGALMTVGGCSATEFPHEGPGQPPERAYGSVPPGSIGACRKPFSKRPPLVNEALWKNLRVCSPKTPYRFIRVGYGKTLGDNTEADHRMGRVLKVLKKGMAVTDGNARMLGLLRSVRREALALPSLRARVERASGRTVPCNYTYLLTTSEKAHAKLGHGERCAAFAYDTKARKEVCLFDTSLEEAVWLTSIWGCVAFTGTVGEGQSCYRLCAYDDFCAGQVSCAAADLDLVLCTLGVCLPERTAGYLH